MHEDNSRGNPDAIYHTPHLASVKDQGPHEDAFSAWRTFRRFPKILPSEPRECRACTPKSFGAHKIFAYQITHTFQESGFAYTWLFQEYSWKYKSDPWVSPARSVHRGLGHEAEAPPNQQRWTVPSIAVEPIKGLRAWLRITGRWNKNENSSNNKSLSFKTSGKGRMRADVYLLSARFLSPSRIRRGREGKLPHGHCIPACVWSTLAICLTNSTLNFAKNTIWGRKGF